MRWIIAVMLATASVAAAEPVRLRVGTLAIDGSRYMIDSLALGREIEKRTGGAVILDWVSGGQLGDEAAMAGLIARGKLDGGGLSETGLAALVPEMAAWGAPGRFHSYDEVERATTALDATVRELFAAHDVVFAMWADLGFARVFSADPIDDVAAVLRAPALALPLDGKLTEAIASGRARTWALPPLYMLAIGASHARHMANLRYRYIVGGLVFSTSAWSRLTPTQQDIVRDACRAWEPRLRASWRKETERGIAALDKAGVETRVVTQAEATAFLDDAARVEPGALGTKISVAIGAR